ncbi:hypothetical protein IFM12275_53440 [Nocardia sputorum]|uniref:Uncharacterized protein n=1 Tax=Nocardia sputorum TaxID=2984338 RepID=A0ABM8D231_9NOCA|nr:hypothetical protein IFM12275_53440 [Nocardia sputorum]BDU01374.1 hypothetical protein IFM12276_44020 [Nocardia sputorum]
MAVATPGALAGVHGEAVDPVAVGRLHRRASDVGSAPWDERRRVRECSGRGPALSVADLVARTTCTGRLPRIRGCCIEAGVRIRRAGRARAMLAR